jgi:hypothetical protein
MITRRHLFSTAGGLVAFSATPAVAAEAEPRIGFMEIKRNGSQPSGKGPADYFTGTVRIDPLFQASEPARGTGASVTFEPGARTAWHTHPQRRVRPAAQAPARKGRSGAENGFDFCLIPRAPDAKRVCLDCD